MTETLLAVITVLDKKGNAQQHYYEPNLPRIIHLGENAETIKIRRFKEI